MVRDILTPDQVAKLLNMADLVERARIFEGKTQKPFAVQAVTLDLSTARLETNPYRVNFPFRSVYVQDTTDRSTEISVKLISDDSIQSAFKLRQNDALSNSYPFPGAVFYWDAQASKSITLVFFIDAEFRSGKIITQSTGGVTLSDGSTFGPPTRVTLSAATAAVILPANPDRITATVQNNTGADLFIAGDNTVTNSGATRGISVSNGEKIVVRNTAALYGYSVAGGDVNYVEEEG